MSVSPNKHEILKSVSFTIAVGNFQQELQWPLTPDGHTGTG